MKFELPAKTPEGVAALSDANSAIVRYLAAEADVADFDGVKMILDRVRFHSDSDPDESDAVRDKHSARLVLVLKPSKE